MNYEEAKHVLLTHGPGTWDKDRKPIVKADGFLGTLRPYDGLKENNFHEVMEAVFTAGHHFSSAAEVDREVVHAVCHICWTARAWGVDSRGMLRSNKLISDDDLARLRKWIDVIECSMLRLLSGRSLRDSITYYADYVFEFGAGNNADYAVTLFVSALEAEKLKDPTEVAEALGSLGSTVKPALPQLREAAKRTYEFSKPTDRCTAEVRAALAEAIELIESGDTQTECQLEGRNQEGRRRVEPEVLPTDDTETGRRGLAACGRCGDWSIDVDLLGMESQSWEMSIESTRFYIRVAIDSHEVATRLRDFLARCSNTEAFEEMFLGTIGRSTVLLLKDSEFADRFFLVVNSWDGTVRHALHGVDPKNLLEALDQVLAELDEKE